METRINIGWKRGRAEKVWEIFPNPEKGQCFNNKDALPA